MIELISSPDFKISDFTGNDIFSVKINALYEAYGLNRDFLLFYKITDKGDVKGIACRFGNTVTVSALKDYDFAELYKFAEFFQSTLEGCGFEDLPHKSCTVGNIFKATDFDGDTSILKTPDITALYELMSASKSSFIQLPPFNDFYPDLSHRIRHGISKTYGIYEGNQLVAGAYLSFVWKDKSIISGVCVRNDMQNRGLGQAIVKGIIADEKLSGRTSYLMLADELEGFYIKCGAKPCGKFKRLEF